MSDNLTVEAFVALQAENVSLKEAQALAVGTAVAAERNRVVDIINSGNTFGIDSATVVKAITKNYTLDIANDVFTSIAEAKDATNAITTSASNLGSANTSVINQMQADKDNTFMSIFEQAVDKLYDMGAK